MTMRTSDNGSAGQERILVCVPWNKAEPRFLKQFPEWFAANKFKHNLILHLEVNKSIHKVYDSAAALARSAGFTHVLFMEDDHWGWPVNGLAELLKEDKDVIGFHTYNRNFPYRSFAMKKMDPSISFVTRVSNLLPHEKDAGPDVQQTDLLTWAMTLVKTSVFDRMLEAGKFPFERNGPTPNDSIFSQYCEDVGIERFVHFGATIGHGRVRPEHIPIMRRAGEAIQALEGHTSMEDTFDPDEPKPAPTIKPETIEAMERNEASLKRFGII